MQIYESKPTDREGESIDTIVNEAITATASTGEGATKTAKPAEKAAYYKKRLGIVSGVAGAEAFALVLMLIF